MIINKEVVLRSNATEEEEHKGSYKKEEGAVVMIKGSTVEQL